jgi:hypothetical protein
MGTETIPERNSGQTIVKSFFNNLRSVLSGNHVPRNLSGVPSDQAGDLGESTFRWGDSYLKSIFLGIIASGLKISESGAAMRFDAATGKNFSFYINSVLRGFIDEDGIDGAGLKNLSVPFSSTEARVENSPASLGQVGVGNTTAFGQSTASATFVDAGTEVTFASKGGTVFLALEAGGNSVGSHIGVFGTSGTAATAEFRFLRDAVPLLESRISVLGTPGDSLASRIPPGSLIQFDQPSAGTYVYKLQFRLDFGTAAVASEVRIRAFEI